MKKILFTLFIAAFAFIGNAPAQGRLSTEEVLNTLNAMPIFVQYKNFRQDLEKTTLDLSTKQGITPKEYEQLRVAYTAVEGKYDLFLLDIKKDLSRYATIKQMIAHPSTFAARYSDNYADVINTHQTVYMPVFNAIKNKGAGKAVTIIINPELIMMGMEVFQDIVKWIKDRKEMQAETVEMLLPLINQHFYNQLRMKKWSELGTTPPSPNGGEVVPPTPTTIIVPPPTVEEMQGSISFEQTAPAKKPMAFTQKIGKNLIIVEDKEDTSPAPTPSNLQSTFFYSTDAYATGTKFRIKVQSTAFVYVIALNQENGIETPVFLYPAIKVKPKSSGGFGKNIVVTEDMPTPIATVMKTLPSETSSFQITAEKPQEDFCILFSKSELVPADIINKIQAVKGTLDERVTQIIGNQRIKAESAGLKLSGDNFEFKVEDSEHAILPLVFVIHK